ncbi:hypothetical protein EVAR_53169_1 [Eumeta japonica]|uniref:Uncharacterized protein n=1 Tax=Eumeta variegata TaxID=151549 RepID=A0A4C1YZJ0_EUMVA|nr:hypothetical protein EVAR_53169_1 [Eumeta japonica]
MLIALDREAATRRRSLAGEWKNLCKSDGPARTIRFVELVDDVGKPSTEEKSTHVETYSNGGALAAAEGTSANRRPRSPVPTSALDGTSAKGASGAYRACSILIYVMRSTSRVFATIDRNRWLPQNNVTELRPPSGGRRPSTLD